MATSEINYSSGTVVDLESDTVTPATLLEGETAHDATGAPITGTMRTVPDSEKLGGKSPEYYLTPVNLVRNSDFSNPLNTNGYASGTLGNADDCIDGWLLRNGTSLSLESGFVRLSGSYDIWQNIPHTLKSGATYTIAARLRAAGGSRTVWMYAEDAAGNRYATPTNENNGEWVTLVDSFTLTSNVSNLMIFFTNSGDSSVATDIAWGALYEGAYTADSLPPYVPSHPRVESLKIGNPVQPVNLLDNSWFGGRYVNGVKEGLVYQAGFNGLHGTRKYPMDRWISWDKDVIVADGYVTITSPYDQVLDLTKIDVNKTYTAAACFADGTIKVRNGTFANSFGSYAGNGFNCTISANNGLPYIRIWHGAADNYRWIALYEGAYTLETLPPYVPKWYEVELAACRYRYIELKLAQWEKLAFGESFGEGYFDCLIPVGNMAPGYATVTLPKQGLYIDGGVALNATPNKTAVYGPMMFLQLYDPQFIVGIHNIGCAETTATIAISRDL